jgi:hypothetical protein
MKKLLLTAAAVAMPLGAIAATTGVAGAGPSKVDVSHASIDCTGVTGTVKFAPALTLAGGKPENSNVKLSLSGCTVSGVAGVTVSAGKGAGVLHSASNNAVTLLGPNTVTGSVKIKWTSSSKLSSKDSTVSVTVVTGGTPSDGYASLAVVSGNASVAGDFAGSDSGATSTLYTETTQTVSTLTTESGSKQGIKSVTLGTDGTHTTPNSLHLG